MRGSRNCRRGGGGGEQRGKVDVSQHRGKSPSADPEGGDRGVRPPPWKITSYIGLYRE